MNHHAEALRRHPSYKPTRDWSRANVHFYAQYRDWLKDSHTGQTMIPRYTAAARWVFCLIDKPYWQLDPDADLARVQAYAESHFDSAETRKVFRHALARFEVYLRLKCQQPAPTRQVCWARYIGALPSDMGQDVRAYVEQRRARWTPHTSHERALDTLTRLMRPLRHIAGMGALNAWADLTPKVWWRYVEMRLAKGLNTTSLNSELHAVQSCLRFVGELGRPVCERMFSVQAFKSMQRVPRDAPVQHVRQVLQAVRQQSKRQPINQGRLGLLDLAWMLLMLHCGLRSGEVRRLRLGDVDWPRRFVRIEQSKGLKDRLVPLSDVVLAALQAYLAVRGPAEALPAELFVFQHKALSRPFFRARLRFYEGKTGVHLTAHQLRHTCATLLLNAGAPVTTVKLILGHVHVDTTLGYARVYDGTLAADYHRAMLSIERALDLAPDAPPAPLTSAHIVALLDSLKTAGALNPQQLDALALARGGVVGLAAPTLA